MKRFYISALYLVLATSFAYGGSIHLELTAIESMEYVEHNGGVEIWHTFQGNPYVTPRYEENSWGYFNDNPEVFVTYKFALDFYVQNATVSVQTLFQFSDIFNAYALLDVGTNGVAWTNVPTNDVVDISTLVHNSDTIYLRGRLWSEYGPPGCKWVYQSNGSAYGMMLDASGFDYLAPEPDGIILFSLGTIGLMFWGLRNKRRLG